MLLSFIFVAFLLTSVLVLMLALRPSPGRRILRARLSSLRPESAHVDARGIALSDKENAGWINQLGSLIQRHRIGAALHRLILHAGSTTPPGKMVLQCAGLGSAAGLLLLCFTSKTLLAFPAAAAAAFIPILLLLAKKTRRLHKFNEALPDAIDLMARALRAGHSVGSSIEVIAQQSPEPLAGEFADCFQQQKFGIPFRDALIAMGERVPCADLDFFITAVLVQKETGGDLTDVLDRTTHLIRDRVRIAGEIKTYTAQGRLTGWILSALPLILLLIMNLLSPGYSSVLFTDPTGKLLLAAGGIMILIGGFVITRIVDIKV